MIKRSLRLHLKKTNTQFIEASWNQPFTSLNTQNVSKLFNFTVPMAIISMENILIKTTCNYFFFSII